MSQKRSRERRELLLDAAIELFAEGGSRAVTHRAVAQAAGLPPATTTYYFDSIEDLLREALLRNVDQWVTKMLALAEFPIDTLLIASDFESALQLSDQVWENRPIDESRAELSVLLAASRDPLLRDAARDALQTLEDIAAKLLDRSGLPRAHELASSLIDVVLGASMRRQCSDASQLDLTTRLIHSMRAITAAHIAGDERISEQLRTAVAERDS